jgi:hypothetical protein
MGRIELALLSTDSARSRRGRFHSSVDVDLGEGAGTSFAWQTQDPANNKPIPCGAGATVGWIGPRRAWEADGTQQRQTDRTGCLQHEAEVVEERSLAEAAGATAPASSTIPAIAVKATKRIRD